MKENPPHLVLNLKRTEILDRLLTKNPTKNQTKTFPLLEFVLKIKSNAWVI